MCAVVDEHGRLPRHCHHLKRVLEAQIRKFGAKWEHGCDPRFAFSCESEIHTQARGVSLFAGCRTHERHVLRVFKHDGSLEASVAKWAAGCGVVGHPGAKLQTRLTTLPETLAIHVEPGPMRSSGKTVFRRLFSLTFPISIVWCEAPWSGCLAVHKKAELGCEAHVLRAVVTETSAHTVCVFVLELPSNKWYQVSTVEQLWEPARSGLHPIDASMVLEPPPGAFPVYLFYQQSFCTARARPDLLRVMDAECRAAILLQRIIRGRILRGCMNDIKIAVSESSGCSVKKYIKDLAQQLAEKREKGVQKRLAKEEKVRAARLARKGAKVGNGLTKEQTDRVWQQKMAREARLARHSATKKEKQASSGSEDLTFHRSERMDLAAEQHQRLRRGRRVVSRWEKLVRRYPAHVKEDAINTGRNKQEAARRARVRAAVEREKAARAAREAAARSSILPGQQHERLARAQRAAPDDAAKAVRAAEKEANLTRLHEQTLARDAAKARIAQTSARARRPLTPASASARAWPTPTSRPSSPRRTVDGENSIGWLPLPRRAGRRRRRRRRRRCSTAASAAMSVAPSLTSVATVALAQGSRCGLSARARRTARRCHGGPCVPARP